MITMNNKTLARLLDLVAVKGDRIKEKTQYNNILDLYVTDGVAEATMYGFDVLRRKVVLKDASIKGDSFGVMYLDYKGTKEALKVINTTNVIIDGRKLNDIYSVELSKENKAVQSHLNIFTSVNASIAEQGEIVARLALSEKEMNTVQKQVLPCISDYETRYFMTGVALSRENGSSRLVATDGKRMAVMEVSELSKEDDTSNTSTIIRSEALRQYKGLGTFSLLVMRNNANSLLNVQTVCEDGKGTYVITYTRNIEGRFPNYTRVIPESKNLDCIFIDREELSDSIAAVSPAIKKEKCKMFAIVRDNMVSRVESNYTNDTKQSEGKEHLRVFLRSLRADARNFALILKPEYMKPVLATKENTIAINYWAEGKAITVQQDNVLHVIMPMTI